MGFAEKKVELFRIVVDADEETTGKLIEFAHQLNNPSGKYSVEDLAKFHATREKYLNGQGSTMLMEDAHAYVRSLKKK